MGLRGGEEQQQGPVPDQRAWRTYWTMVILMVVLLVVGLKVLAGMHHRELSLLWGALIVGAHFLPFAKVFGAPLFLRLTWTMITLGLIGGVFAVVISPPVGTFVAGVLSGFVLLASALPSRRAMATV